MDEIRTEVARTPILKGTFAFRGDEVEARPAGNVSITAAGGDERQCVAPGLAIAWNTRQAAHAVRDGSICIVWGAPRCHSLQSPAVSIETTAQHILERLLTSGTSALASVKGGFGIAFVDTAARRLILAVDRFSIESLCFGIDGDHIAFADRADAVARSVRTISSQRLYDYAYFHCIPAPATVFAEVERVPHGGHVQFAGDGIHRGYHCNANFTPARDPSFTQLRDEFRELLRAAVSVEVQRGNRLGCFLSGGTDSSTIAGTLGEVSGEPAKTYSIGFDAPGYDEMHYARIASAHFHTDHHEYYVTADDLLSGIPDVARSFDQPFGNSSVVPAYFCARMARADGVTRLLAGDGGDELFGGNSRYRMQQLFDHYRQWPAPLRARVIEPVLARTTLAALPGMKQAAAYVRHANIPMPDRMESFNLIARVGAARVFSAELLAAVDIGAPLQSQRDAYARSGTANFVDRMLYYDWQYTLAATDLPKVRGATALTGLSVGYPLLADEIAEFSMRLPQDYKVRRFKLRWFFKEALRDFLPVEIIRKKKHGFGLPFGVWATRHAALRDLASDSLAGLERRAILRPGFRDELMRELLPAHPGYYGELVWILMMLEQWLVSRSDAVVSFSLPRS